MHDVVGPVSQVFFCYDIGWIFYASSDLHFKKGIQVIFFFRILLNKHLLIVKGFAMHSNSSKVGRPSKLMENFAKKSWVC